MKIEYGRQAKAIPLSQVENGQVFRPLDNEHLYIASDLTAADNLFADDINDYVSDPQELGTTPSRTSYYDFVVCYDITFNTIALMDHQTQVEVLDCTLRIEN